MRRKFYDLQQAHASPLATEAVQRIGQLYAIESEIRGRSAEERKQVRQARARPVLEAMHPWLEASYSKLSRKSDVARAIHYALNRWTALTWYVEDGQIEIDNNAAERALRVVALVVKISCSPDRTQVGNARHPFTAYWAPPNWTGLTRKPTYAKC